MLATSLLESRAAGTPMAMPISDQQEDLPHDQPAYVHAIRAERHADADLVGPPADHVGHQAVDADGGEKDCEQAEESGELRDDALIGEGAGDLLIERGDVRDGQVAVDLVDGLLHCGSDGGEVAGVADPKSPRYPGCCVVGKIVERIPGLPARLPNFTSFTMPMTS